MYAASMRGGLALLALVAFACSGEREGDGDDANPSGAGGEGGGSAVGSDTGRDGAISTGGGGNDGAGAGGGGTAGGSAGRAGGSPPIAGAGVSPPVAVAVPDLDGEVVDCIDTAPPKSFEPDLQWSFGDAEGRNNSYVMPLVANLTDDDGNGQIDLDDIPDVIVVLFGASVTDARLVALDGATGALHWISDASVRQDVTPALGDIDGDGLPEIVTLTRESEWRVGHLIAFDHEGRRQWTGDLVDQSQLTISIDEVCLALADMDADGDVEILVGNALYDHRGALLWKASVDPPFWSATAAADLDGDGEKNVNRPKSSAPRRRRARNARSDGARDPRRRRPRAPGRCRAPPRTLRHHRSSRDHWGPRRFGIRRPRATTAPPSRPPPRAVAGPRG
jgi:hypothetical protein